MLDVVIIEMVFVAVGVGFDVPQPNQPREPVTVTVAVSSTTLVTTYLFSIKGVASVIEPKSQIAKVMDFILKEQ